MQTALLIFFATTAGAGVISAYLWFIAHNGVALLYSLRQEVLV